MPSPRNFPISEYAFQLFVYHRYIEPIGHKDLTEMQKRVRQVVRKWDGDITAAAKDIGVSTQNIQGHISLIESKGWRMQ